MDIRQTVLLKTFWHYNMMDNVLAQFYLLVSNWFIVIERLNENIFNVSREGFFSKVFFRKLIILDVVSYRS